MELTGPTAYQYKSIYNSNIPETKTLSNGGSIETSPIIPYQILEIL